MRIAQVCPYSLSVPGGVQGQVLGLSRALREAGEEVTVLAPLDGPPPDTGIVSVGRSIGIPANGSVAPLALHPSAVARTLLALRSGRFDVVQVHEPLAPGPSLVALLSARCPVVGTFHRSGRSVAYTALKPLARVAASRLSARCAVSREAMLTAEESLGGSFTIMFNAVDQQAFARADPRPKSGPAIIFVGRHEKRKGLSVLIDALERLHGSATLWVVGEGPQSAGLRRASGQQVEWLGQVTDSEKASLIKGADVLCAPSLSGESFGMVLLEAMAAGTAVVASDLPGYRTVATDGVDSLLVPPGDAAALAAALTNVLEDDALRKRLVQGGERVAEAHSMRRLASAYDDLFSSLAAA